MHDKYILLLLKWQWICHFRLNDIIVRVGDEDVSNTTHTAAVDALKRAGSKVVLVSLGLLNCFSVTPHSSLS